MPRPKRACVRNLKKNAYVEVQERQKRPKTTKEVPPARMVAGRRRKERRVRVSFISHFSGLGSLDKALRTALWFASVVVERVDAYREYVSHVLSTAAKTFVRDTLDEQVLKGSEALVTTWPCQPVSSQNSQREGLYAADDDNDEDEEEHVLDEDDNEDDLQDQDSVMPNRSAWRASIDLFHANKHLNLLFFENPPGLRKLVRGARSGLHKVISAIQGDRSCTHIAWR